MARLLPRVLGPEHAATLMTLVPGVSSDQLATKSDLLALKHELQREMALSEQRVIAAFRAELNAAVVSQTRAIIFGMVGSVTANTVLIFSILQIT